MEMHEILEATEPMEPYQFDPETDMRVGGAFSDIADITDAVLRAVTSVFE